MELTVDSPGALIVDEMVSVTNLPIALSSLSTPSGTSAKIDEVIDAGPNLTQSHSTNGPASTEETTNPNITEVHSGGLIVHVNYDSSVSSAPAGFRSAIDYVVNFLQTNFSDPVTININVGWGEVNGQSVDLGASIRATGADLSYTQLRNDLIGDAKSTDDSAALSTLPSSDPTGGGNFGHFVGRAQQKAIGVLSADDPAVDGWVGFGSGQTYTFDPNNRSVSGAYDFIGVAFHEFTEIMGRVTWVGQNFGGVRQFSAMDLWRYSASGVRDLAVTPPNNLNKAYFSLDNGATDLGDWNYLANNGDYGDWYPGLGNDAFNDYGTKGAAGAFSLVDFRLMDVIGWDRGGSTPPPPNDDFANSLSDITHPFGTVVINGSSTGNLETVGDRDWFRVQLSAGTYTINLQGSQAAAGTLEDPYLRVHNSTGGVIAENDDIALGVNRDSRLTFTATAGTYYLEAGAFNDGYTGTYRLSVAAATPPDDFANSFTDTAHPFGQVTVNGSGTGNLEVTGDRDWFRIQLTAGSTYTINLQGLQAGAGTLEDPYLRVHNGSGALVAENDDIINGTNRDSRLTFVAATTGIYYLEAGAFSDNYTGTYKISVSGAAPPDDYADSLTDRTAPFGEVAASGASGTLEALGDRDWFRVQLDSGTTYTINLQGQQAAAGTLEDPYLRLHNSVGTLLAENDDIVLGTNRDSRLTFTPTTTGTYYIEAGAFSDSYTGTYKVTVVAAGFGVHSVQWAGSVDLGVRSPPYQVAGVGDFNKDGTDDILWRDPTTGKLDEWHIVNGQWAGSTDLGSHGTDWQVAALGDLDGDGTANILWRNANTGQLDEWRMGNGNWAGTVPLGSHGPDWQVAGLGDFNNDGTDDILWRNPSTGQMDEWRMSNGNWASSILFGSHGANWVVAGIGDFNHDGNEDVLWRNPTTGQLDEWKLVNGQWAGSVDLGFFNAAWQVAAVKDFNGDGTADVLWRNPTTGQVDGWVMQNGQWAGSFSLGSFDPAYQVAGSGDFNHSFTSDVLWRNPVTGQTSEWLLASA